VRRGRESFPNVDSIASFVPQRFCVSPIRRTFLRLRRPGNNPSHLRQASRHVLKPLPLLVIRCQQDHIDRLHKARDIKDEVLRHSVTGDDFTIMVVQAPSYALRNPARHM
jgi:hypothetical protein